MLEVALTFDAPGGEAGAPTPTDLARSLRVQPEDVADVTEALRGAHLLRGLASGGLLPGRPLERISLLDVRAAVHGPPPPRPEGEAVSVDRALDQVEAEAAAQLAATSYRDLCDEERGRLERVRVAPPSAEPGAP
jgi:membrane protein